MNGTRSAPAVRAPLELVVGRLVENREELSMSIATLAGLKPHGIPRAAWVRRFCDEIKRAANADDDIAAAELESWPESDDDWLTEDPENAARENLSNWTNDE